MFKRKKSYTEIADARLHSIFQTIELKELLRILHFNNFEWQAYLMDKRGRKPRPSFSNNWPSGIKE